MVSNDSRGSETTCSSNRRTYLKTLAGATAAAMAAGCAGLPGGGGNTQNPNNTASGGDLSGRTIHFISVAATPSIKDLWNGVASDFENETGAKVNVEFVQTSDISRITQLIQAGDPPEVTQLGLTNTYLLKNRGILEPLNSVYEKATQRLGTPTKTVQRVVQQQGDAVMAPLFHNINMYSYRRDLADIVPDTWEKAIEYARVVDQQDNNVRGTYVPITGSVPGVVRLVSWLWPNKGSISHRDENGHIDIDFNEEPYRGRMIELFKMLKARQQYSPSGTGAGWADIQNIIQTGRAASSWYGGVRQKNAAIRNDRPFAKDVKLIPGMPVKRKNTTDGSTEGLVTFKGADTKAAKAFITYVTQKDFLVNLLTQLSPIHNIPSWPGVKDSEAYLSGIKSLDLWSGWSMEQFDNYQKDAFSHFQSKTMDTQPPNPYSVTYYSDPMFNLSTDILQRDIAPGKAIDNRASQLQQVVNEVQSQ